MQLHTLLGSFGYDHTRHPDECQDLDAETSSA
jgi:hypothetical protein